MLHQRGSWVNRKVCLRPASVFGDRPAPVRADDPPFDDMHCEYGWASGRSYLDCVCIGRRWRERYGTMLVDSDYYVVVNRPERDVSVRTYARWGPWPNIMMGLWRALPSERVYACDTSQQSVHVWDDVMDVSRPARVHPLGFGPEGIWGLDEEHVYVWGIFQRAPGTPGEPHLARFDGTEWKTMPHPGFFIVEMHGLAPDNLYAVGRGGIARWDGGTWIRFPLPTAGIFTDVFVAGPDEMYATTLNGALLEGTANGWSVITRTIDDRLPYACVIKFAGELLVGGSFQGLFRRVGKTHVLELIEPDLHANQFEARAGSLIVTTPDRIAGSTDAVKFTAAATGVLLDLTRSIDICER